MSVGDLVSSFKAASQTLSYLVQTLQRQGPGAFGNTGSNSTTVSPNAYAYTIGTTSVATIGTNQSRIGLLFHNPNLTAVVAFCPTFNSATGTALAASVNGSGSFSLVAGATLRLEGLRVTCAWNAVASTTAALTIWEYV